ncbi:MAG: N-formylglutamate deformylase [Nitrospinaceae bacterium]|nr:MAG: N-formylglutamate deformylase [Nitrospinaceae bacterium]
MAKLPFLISIPHGGTKTPQEISDRVCITQKDLFEDGDAFTREIYGIRDEVQAFIETDIARAFVDLNRETSDRPPKNPDGIVKTKTCHGQPIYSPGLLLDETIGEELIQKYHDPYHKKIRELLNTHSGIKLGLDCHTMEPVGPPIAPDSGKERPLICLGNNYGKSCSDEWVQKLAECLQEGFHLKAGDVTINEPFAGGYITRKYGNDPVPWIQIEMNRKLYLSNPWFDPKSLTVDPRRLSQLREAFKTGLNLFEKTL